MNWSEAAIALVTLTGMEIVLGIDNIVFISILVAKVPQHLQARVRSLGISLALISRLLLLFSLSWLMQLTQPWLSFGNWSLSGRDLILILGGLFLIGKSTIEIHDKVEEPSDHNAQKGTLLGQNVQLILAQIILLDIVFSLDSVITAIGMVQQIWIMVTAMILAVFVMLFSAKSIGSFVNKHPTIKILALSFLLLIGVMLVLDGMGHHIPKGYIYFAMFFALMVEMLNLRMQLNRKAHKLDPPQIEPLQNQ